MEIKICQILWNLEKKNIICGDHQLNLHMYFYKKIKSMYIYIFEFYKFFIRF